MKLKLFVYLTLVLSGVLSSYGLSTQISVTPKTLKQGEFVFSVSTNSTTEGISFHLTVTAKTGIIFSNSEANLSIVTKTSGSGVIQPVKSVTLQKHDRYWTADFIATPELLKTPNLCFVFTAHCHSIENGKIVPMPCADFYELKLQDFLKP